MSSPARHEHLFWGRALRRRLHHWLRRVHRGHFRRGRHRWARDPDQEGHVVNWRHSPRGDPRQDQLRLGLGAGLTMLVQKITNIINKFQNLRSKCCRADVSDMSLNILRLLKSTREAASLSRRWFVSSI